MSGRVVFFQVLVQGINAITGLALVRGMSKADYAWFTVAGSFLATLNLLGDGGITTGITTLGGRTHEDSGRFSRLLHESLRLATLLSTVGFFLALPFYIGIYLKISAPQSVIIGVAGLALLSARPTVVTSVLNAANRVQKKISAVQTTDLIAASARLVLTMGIAAAGALTILPVMATTASTIWLQALMVKSTAKPLLVSPDAPGDERSQLIGFVRVLYLNNAFFCVQGQVCTWIIGALGTSNELADLGALTRLTVIFTAVTAPIGYLAVPAVARAKSRQAVLNRIIWTLGAIIFGLAVLVAAGVLAPWAFLWLLGEKYVHLQAELPLALASQAVSILTTLAWSLVLARGWVRHAWFTVVTAIIGYGLGALTCELHTVSGILWFSFVAALPTLLFCAWVIMQKLRVENVQPLQENDH